jgi:hypothetical protein
VLFPILNVRWVSTNPEDRWVHRLHNVWSIRLSYKLRDFVWLVMYQEILSKPQLAKSGLFDGFCLVCHCSNTVKHIFSKCRFAKCCWNYLDASYSVLFQGKVHWRAAFFQDCCSLVRTAFSGIWQCLHILSLFILWKIKCKSIFDHEISSLSSF